MNDSRLTVVLLLALSSVACGQETSVGDASVAATYSTGVQSRGGTGRYYMGREIAQVMSHRGAGWLDRSEREEEERTDLLLELMELQADSVIADIGAGSGYFSLPMARRAPDGRVYAVDVQPEMLAIIAGKAASQNVENIVTVLATPSDPRLAEDTNDVALLVDVYHELASPLEVMTAVRNSLKPDGRLYLVEYRAEDPTVPILPLHKMTERQARAELEAAGFEWIETRTELPQQHVLVFGPGSTPGKP